MKNKNYGKSKVSFWGGLIFFVLIAFVIQIAVLVFSYVREKTDSNSVIAIVMLAVIIVLSLLCTIVDAFRRRYTVDKPINEILNATERISEGDFKVRLNPTNPYGKYNGYDLIKLNINIMAEALSKSEILKTDFISNVSHELKTPLSVIRNYATLLKDDNINEESKTKYVKTIILATNRLTNLIDNILKLNKLENSELSLNIEKFCLTDSLTNSVLTFEDVIDEKNIELVCEFDDVYLKSSEAYLEIVWNNLISNAVKFTQSGGKITVSLKKQGNSAVVSVSDTGIGISEETGTRIFEKFYQADTSHSEQGNGLGLALVKKVIDVLGGDISVSSKVNVGTTFTVTLKGVEDESAM